MEAALTAVRPGATCGSVAAAFNATLKKHGFEKESRCGYRNRLDGTHGKLEGRRLDYFKTEYGLPSDARKLESTRILAMSSARRSGSPKLAPKHSRIWRARFSKFDAGYRHILIKRACSDPAGCSPENGANPKVFAGQIGFVGTNLFSIIRATSR